MQEAYFEEEMVVEEYQEPTSTDQPTLLTVLGRWALVAFAFLMPVFVLPWTLSPIDLNKGYFAAFMVALAVMLWFGGALQEGSIRLPRTWIIYTYVLFLGSILLASLFSQNPIASLVGVGGETDTFLTFLIGGLFLIVIPALINDRVWVYRAILGLVGAFAVVMLFFIVRSIFNINPFEWSSGRSANLIGGWSIVGAFFAMSAALLLPFLNIEKKSVRVVVGILFASAVIGIALTNFTYSAMGLGLVLLLMLALLLSRRMGRSVMFGASLIMLIVLTLIILMRGPLGEVSGRLGAPVEASPNWTVTTSLIEKAFGESLLFGHGPNTFGVLWDRYKPVELNSTPLWAVRFTAGSALAPTIIAGGGLLAAITLLFFYFTVFAFVFRGLAAFTDHEGDTMLLRSLAGALVVMLFLWWMHPLNGTLVILTLFILGLFVSAMNVAGLARVSEINLFSSTERGFITSLAIILLLIGSVAGVYYEAMRYVSQVAFAEGVNAYNAGEGINTARISMTRAAQYDSRQDQYWRALTQLETVNLQRIISTRDVPQNELQERFRLALSSAIDYGKHATDAGPQDSANWTAIAQVYETVIFMPGSYDFALEYYDKAAQLAPTNPQIPLNIARTHIGYANALLLQDNSKENQNRAVTAQNKAVEALEKAVSLKPDFAEAHFLLAQIYQQQGKTNDAIARAESAFQLRPNDIGVLFQLGVLYYQKNDFARAKVAFERAVEQNSDYSNALYFLGLIYDKEGAKEKALETFRKVASLNANNKEIQTIITNLEAGKPALESVETPPEDRATPPVSESVKPVPER
ncbi:MAG: tetratricopeptide repeat protein [Patescibacteria group bacterium]